ncbi:MAG: MFS transporter, partial [Rhodospirillaceae bacterium]|nr:MFS transporter [Rhodospirillaceae bacterium]
MAEAGSPAAEDRKGLIAWSFYDWANSAFPTVITTFVFAAYFAKGVAADEVTGTSQWGYALSLSGLAIAIAGPILGAIADRTGRRKPWIALFTLIAALASLSLWQVEPDTRFVMTALISVAVANFAFEMGMVFYNAMLPDLSPPARIGRWSGWAWGLGYTGGLTCLALVLVGFVQAETPWFGLDKDTAEHLRATGPFVAIWMAVFALPLLLLTPDRPNTPEPMITAIREGLTTLADTLKNLRRYRDAAWFLLARMIYTDGLNTLFAFGGIYAAGTFGMNFQELILFGIAMNVTAGLGAFGFAWADDKLGAKWTITVAVAALVVLGSAVLVIESKTLFWVFGVPLGLFVGPAQAASRSMMARLAPAQMRTEFFGLYALSGKATAFMGP